MLLEAPPSPPPQGACTKLLFVCRGHSQAAEEKGVTESLGLSVCLSVQPLLENMARLWEEPGPRR